MKKLITLLLATILLTSGVLAMNMWMSWNLFEDIEVEQGFHGYYIVRPFEDADYQYNPFIRWGTRDEMEYRLTVTADGEGGKFFKKYKKKVKIDNLKSYQYNVYMNVPKSTDVGSYPYELCGTICGPAWFGNLCLSICKVGNVIIS